ncbi:MAG: hypothetical protein ACTSXG_04225 [Alphaproteobacteria bacterium]
MKFIKCFSIGLLISNFIHLTLAMEPTQVKGLQEAFEGKAPFYAFTITRTAKDDYMYNPIFEDDVYLVFATLNKFFNPSLQIDFKKNTAEIEQRLMEKRDVIEKQYMQLHETINAKSEYGDKLRTLIIRKKLRDKLKIKKNKDEFEHKLENNEILLDIILKHYSSKQQFDEKFCSQDFFLKKGRIQQRQEFFKSFFEQTVTLSEQDKNECVRNNIHPSDLYLFDNYKQIINTGEKEKIFEDNLVCINGLLSSNKRWESLIDQWCMIVFNEMFFSKTEPLSKSDIDIILKYASQFTAGNPKTILHMNFLFTDNRKLVQDDLYLLKRDEFLHTGGGFPLPFQEPGTSKVTMEGYEKYRNSLLQSAQDGMVNTLQNQSFILWNGKIVASYLKASYHEESDKMLANNHLYLFGKGLESICTKDNPHRRVAEVLLDYLSTETCYDLALGVSKSLIEHSKKKIHVFVSNKLKADQYYKNLPAHATLIIHVDPDPEVYQKVVRSKKHPLQARLLGETKHLERISSFVENNPIFSFGWLDHLENKYILQLWDIQDALSKVEKGY